MTEMAVVSSRKTRPRVMAADGDTRAKASLALARPEVIASRMARPVEFTSDRKPEEVAA